MVESSYTFFKLCLFIITMFEPFLQIVSGVGHIFRHPWDCSFLRRHFVRNTIATSYRMLPWKKTLQLQPADANDAIMKGCLWHRLLRGFVLFAFHGPIDAHDTIMNAYSQTQKICEHDDSSPRHSSCSFPNEHAPPKSAPGAPSVRADEPRVPGVDFKWGSNNWETFNVTLEIIPGGVFVSSSLFQPLLGFSEGVLGSGWSHGWPLDLPSWRHGTAVLELQLQARQKLPQENAKPTCWVYITSNIASWCLVKVLFKNNGHAIRICLSIWTPLQVALPNVHHSLASLAILNRQKTPPSEIRCPRCAAAVLVLGWASAFPTTSCIDSPGRSLDRLDGTRIDGIRLMRLLQGFNSAREMHI